MTELKAHTFENGDMLALEAVSSYAGFHGLTVYTVNYLEKDSDPDTGDLVYEDNYMSQAAALAGFDARVASSDPFKGLKKDGGVTNLVLDAFRNYLGEGTLRQTKTPDEWDEFAKHVLEATFSRDGHYYDGEQIHETINGLETTSTEGSVGRADIMMQIPAWKLLEIMTAITALALVLKQQSANPLQKAA